MPLPSRPFLRRGLLIVTGLNVRRHLYVHLLCKGRRIVQRTTPYPLATARAFPILSMHRTVSRARWRPCKISYPTQLREAYGSVGRQPKKQLILVLWALRILALWTLACGFCDQERLSVRCQSALYRC